MLPLLPGRTERHVSSVPPLDVQTVAGHVDAGKKGAYAGDPNKGDSMRTSCVLLLLASFLLVAPLQADQASAREKLEKAGLAFTPEAFLHTVAAGDAAHAALFI